MARSQPLKRTSAVHGFKNRLTTPVRSRAPPFPRPILTDAEQEIGVLDADLAILTANLSTNISLFHQEMHNRASKEATPESKLATEHINTSKFPKFAAAVSLRSSLKSELASGYSKSVHALYREDLLKNATFAKLLSEDANFHRLIDDVAGLKEWWEEGREDWIVKQRELKQLESALNRIGWEWREIYRQKKQAESGEVMRLLRQHQRQSAAVRELKQWFEQQTKILKGVKLRFKQLKLEVQLATTKTPAAEIVPKDFEYTWDDELIVTYNHFTKLRSLPKWWKSGSPRWWFEIAILDIKYREKVTDHKLDAAIEEQNIIDSVKEKEEMREDEVTQHDFSQAATQSENRHKKASKQEMIDALTKKQLHQLTLITNYDFQLERGNSILEYVEKGFGKNGKPLAWLNNGRVAPKIITFYENLRKLCSLQVFHYDLWEAVTEIFNREELSLQDRITLKNKMDAHTQFYQQEAHWLRQMPQAQSPRDLDLANILSRYVQEYRALESLETEANTILSAAQKTKIAPAIDNEDTTSSGVPWLNLSTQELDAIMEQEDSPVTKQGDTLKEALTKFSFLPI